ncbi:phage baseplate protein (plasmid) [Ralstonia syzygii subsp. celebesensis]|uniref:phage baseplate protein n=1 Tax=Ralstonia syzygii TaxID=28097 RepID=UPI00387E0B66
MSLFDNIISGFFSPKRSIGSFHAYITLQEQHHDELVITDHPVEQGAAISDHAYKKPAELTLTIGWSDSSLSALTSLQFGNYSSFAYEQLLSLQAQRILVDISTGKRKYSNMLIQAISTTTDERNENSMIATVHCREVIIVQTKATTLAPAANQAMPQKTASITNTGTKQPQATNTSVLYRIFN